MTRYDEISPSRMELVATREPRRVNASEAYLGALAIASA